MAGISTTASTRRASASDARPHRRAWRLAVGVLLLASFGVAANTDVEQVLAADEAPFGVVFEIVEADEDALEDFLPRVRDSIARIRARFPETLFAVVSHGREEFALQSRYRDEYAAVHQQVQSLVAHDVPVHVCETHAGWYGVTAEDFPDYVDVAPTGPGQVRVYEDMGYALIVVD